MHEIITIDEQMLSQFLTVMMDQNPLHHLEQPVVPGNLLTLLVEQRYRECFQRPLKSISITFVQPTFLGDTLVFDLSLTQFSITTKKLVLIAKGEFNA
ncbi:MAG: MaoC family dehydratase [Lactococcus plantarum]|nr:MaoC family dehydratase [Lactococcus plantarum]MDN6070399.1 MaoC family dehydratase [Lactococcus plantarum]MDN6084250.1 MaoC family dehydratase [Lactococcus plantarum]